MAGLNLLINLSKSKDLNDFEFISGNKLLNNKAIWRTSDMVFNSLIHSGYPYTYFENRDFVIYLEGKVYNLNKIEIKNELEALSNLLSKEFVNKKLITERLFNLDGDYVLVFYDKFKQKVYLLNDIYGRLPLYYAEEEGKYMISRNIDIISKNLNLKELDKYGTAEFLVFGHTVTDKTLVKKIYYFQPGSLLTIDLNKKKYLIQNIFTYNFENIISVTSKNYQKELKKLVELFKTSISQRKGSKSVVGLSGGLDSRILAASFNPTDSNVECVSRLSFNNREKKDINLAKEVANLLKMKFQLIEPEKPSEKFFYEIIHNKLGLNSIENDYNLIYEKLLQSMYGHNFTYFTGDAGDRIKPHISIGKADNLMNFVDKMIKMYSSFDLAQVSKLVNIDTDIFKNNIYQVLESFPEKSYAYKDLHFRIYSRGFKYVLEGEDRKRNFFWTAMPHYGHQFFLSAMSFPDKYKKNHKMVFDFIDKLNPELNNIVNKNWGIAPNDWKLPLYLFRNRVPREVRLFLKKALKKPLNKDVFEEVLEVDSFDINSIYDKNVFKRIELEIGSDRSKQLFIKTPIVLNEYLNNQTISDNLSMKF